jgi:hypothetical protein
MTVSPSTAVAYSGIPMALTISGGTGPFRAFSSNASVLPVMQDVAGRTVCAAPNNVAADTDVTITCRISAPAARRPAGDGGRHRTRDCAHQCAEVTPNLPDCGTALCSGQTALASVTVIGAGHAERFDVIGSSYAS